MNSCFVNPPCRQSLLRYALIIALWLISYSVFGEASLPQGHYLLPETGNIVGEPYTATVEDEEDTLLDIAHAHGVGYEEIRRANPDTSLWVPGKGTPVQIPAQHILPDVERTGAVSYTHLTLPTILRV